MTTTLFMTLLIMLLKPEVHRYRRCERANVVPMVLWDVQHVAGAKDVLDEDGGGWNGPLGIKRRASEGVFVPRT